MVLARIARARGSRAPEVLSNGSAILVSSVLAERALDRRATVDHPRLDTACCALEYKPRATLKQAKNGRIMPFTAKSGARFRDGVAYFLSRSPTKPLGRGTETLLGCAPRLCAPPQ